MLIMRVGVWNQIRKGVCLFMDHFSQIANHKKYPLWFTKGRKEKLQGSTSKHSNSTVAQQNNTKCKQILPKKQMQQSYKLHHKSHRLANKQAQKNSSKNNNSRPEMLQQTALSQQQKNIKQQANNHNPHASSCSKVPTLQNFQKEKNSFCIIER